MDPSRLYNQGQHPNSLSSTTDPNLPYGQSQVNPQQYQAMYAQQAGYPNYGQAPGPGSLSASASYPHTMVQGGVSHRMAGRSSSSPGGAVYSGFGQAHQGQPHQYHPQAMYPAQYSQVSAQHAQAHPPHPAVQYLPSSSQIAQAQGQTYHASPSTSPTSSSSTSSGIERYPCDRCSKTFTRAHDRKRHYETQHVANPPTHKCQFCSKDFSRADSLKRHIDNGCQCGQEQG